MEEVCRFFISDSGCRAGAMCPFQHSRPQIKSNNTAAAAPARPSSSSRRPLPSAAGEVRPAVSRPVNPSSSTGSLKQLLAATSDPEEQAKLTRQLEIQQLERRFPPASQVLKLLMTTAKDSVYKLALEPSDPDFPFDLENNTLLLHLHIPKTYPTTPSRISIHSSEIPPALSRTIERAWALKVGRIKIALLDMIKWLDRDLEKMLSVDTSTSSSIVLVANNATTDFVEDRPLATGPPQNNYYGVPKQDGDEDGDDDSEIEGEVEDEERDGFEDQNEENIDLPRSSSSSTLPQHKGTHIRLPGVNLDNISLLRCISLFLIVKCSRCKSNVDVENLVSAMSTSTSEAATTTSSSSSVTKPRWTSCPICNSEIGLNFRSDFIHQHSTSLGYLDLENCTVFDLLPSTFIATCETCAVENSKLPLKRVLRASPTSSNCESCHAKMTLTIDEVRFVNLAPTTVSQSSTAGVPRRKKQVKDDISLVPGEPLPKNGTCKHYGKSYRWFRFPCCGKLFPCDVCHETGNKDNHQMILANRMVCGFCSKEQAYSADKPCTCGKQLTRTKNASGAFWEGGKGTRDRKKMSKNDPRKYKGLNKTKSVKG